MRNRAERLAWIEDLFGEVAAGEAQALVARGIVVPSAWGLLCVAFPSVVEVMAAKNLKTLSFLSEEFCGVIDRGSSLAPVIDVCDGAEATVPKVLLMRGGEHELGLRYTGTPQVIDLDECPAEPGRDLAMPFPFVAAARLVTPHGSAALLDATATTERLLER